MGARAEALAKRFEEASKAVADIVARLSDAEWKKMTSGEKWSVGVVAHHVAMGHAGIANIVKSVASGDRKSTRLNSSHLVISYAVFCLKKKKKTHRAIALSPPQMTLQTAGCQADHLPPRHAPRAPFLRPLRDAVPYSLLHLCPDTLHS